MPALREHPEDILLIANHLLEKHSAELNQPLKKISPELMEIFLKNPWIGNVREMENIIIQGILFSSTDEIRPSDVDFTKIPTEEVWIEKSLQQMPYNQAKKHTLSRFNAGYINNLLAVNKGNVT
jgi:transcriptional regulator with PAS, ATPase and Fis domain